MDDYRWWLNTWVECISQNLSKLSQTFPRFSVPGYKATEVVKAAHVPPKVACRSTIYYAAM
jgi:uncharacterized protein (DUF1684 family)